jgi:steroid delta-isomerase
MTHAELFHTYLRHYAEKKLDAIAELLAEDVHLRDWNISVFGKAEALRETAKNFSKALSIEIRVLTVYENEDTVAGELHIVLNDTIDLFVVDVVMFNAQGKVTAIRSYKGRGD